MAKECFEEQTDNITVSFDYGNCVLDIDMTFRVYKKEEAEKMKIFISFLISIVSVLLFWYLTFTFGLTVVINFVKSVSVVILLTALIQLLMI